jgi:hypothetical protein
LELAPRRRNNGKESLIGSACAKINDFAPVFPICEIRRLSGAKNQVQKYLFARTDRMAANSRSLTSTNPTFVEISPDLSDR